MVEIAGKKVVWRFDSVSHVIKIENKDIEPPPPIVKGISGRYIIGIGKVDKGFVVILDIDQIFSNEELASISAAVDCVALTGTRGVFFQCTRHRGAGVLILSMRQSEWFLFHRD